MPRKENAKNLKNEGTGIILRTSVDKAKSSIFDRAYGVKHG